MKGSAELSGAIVVSVFFMQSGNTHATNSVIGRTMR